MHKTTLRIFALCVLLLLLPFAALADIAPLPIDFTPGNRIYKKFTLSRFEYKDPSIHVVRSRIRQEEMGCYYYVAKIKIAHPSQLRTMSGGGFNRGMRIEGSLLAKRANAIVAINGDFYAARSERLVLRQGKLYEDSTNDRYDVLLIDENGDFHILMAKDGIAKLDKTTIDGKKVINGFAFGPALIKDGKKVVSSKYAVEYSGPDERRQRMCIAQTGPLEYLFVCCAGPQRGSKGMTLSQLCDVVYDIGGVQNAYNLDGGDSTQLLFLGEKVNDTENPDLRAICDIIYFASAYTQDK